MIKKRILLSTNQTEKDFKVVHFEQISFASDGFECFPVKATIDAAVIYNNNYNRQIISDHRFDFHAREAKG